MIEFNTYEELFTYKTEDIHKINDCIFKNKTLNR